MRKKIRYSVWELKWLLLPLQGVKRMEKDSSAFDMLSR